MLCNFFNYTMSLYIKIKPIMMRRLFMHGLNVFLCVCFSTPVYADPPSHAPAHGWRKKHDPYYVGYNGRNWPRDYGILNGRCDRQAISTVIGGVVGGAIGSSVGRGDNRVVAIILGTVVGAVIGNQIGKRLDDADRGCIGHALELSRNNRPVYWENPNSGFNYTVTPISNFTANGLKCRNYDLLIQGNGINQTQTESACLENGGNWQSVRK